MKIETATHLQLTRVVFRFHSECSSARLDEYLYHAAGRSRAPEVRNPGRRSNTKKSGGLKAGILHYARISRIWPFTQQRITFYRSRRVHQASA